MKKLSAVMFVAAAVGAGCQPKAANTGATTPPVSADLEARMARIEATLAQNAEALDFLRKVYEQQKAAQAAQAAQEARDEPADDAVFAVNIADAIKAGQVEGPANAAVTIVKAFDFACPFCQRSVATLHDLVKENKGKVRVVYMNLVVHQTAKPAHLASCAAAKQNKYNEFKDAFWDKAFLPYADSHDASKLGEDNIYAIAKGVGLNVDKLKAEMHGTACAARLDADVAELQKFHVNATPTFFVNGHEVAGALPKAEFQQLVDEALKQVEGSGVPAAQYYDKVVMAKGEKQFRSKADPKPAN